MVAPPFVGRAAELRALSGELAGVQRGEASRIVVLSGAPGVGKTRLLTELMEGVRPRVRTLIGRGSPLGTAIPFSLVVEGLEAQLRGTPADELRRRLGPAGAALAPVLPSAAAAFGDAGALSTPLRTLEGFLHLFVVLARDRPLVIVLDDAHEADPSTLDLIGYLGRNPLSARVLVIAAIREQSLLPGEAASAILGPLLKDGLASELRLGPLARDEVRALVEATRDAQTAERLADRVYELARGNALFSVALLSEPAVGSAGSVAPRSVKDHVRGRTARLDADCQRVLEAAAALGYSFSLATLAPLIGRSATGCLDVLVRDGLLTVGEGTQTRYDFAHPVVREAIYEGIGAEARRAIHLRIARVATDPPASRAYHALRAALPGDGEMLALVRDGARAAEESQRHREALTLLGGALELVPDGPVRLELLDEIAWQASQIGDYTRGAPALRELAKRRAGDPLGEADARMRLASFLASGTGDLDIAALEARAALELFRRGGAAERIASALNEVAWIQGQAGDVHAQIKGSAAALERAEARGERVTVVHALGSLGHSLALEGRWDEALAASHRGVAVGRELGERAQVQWHIAILSETLAAMGRYEEAAAAIDPLLESGAAELDLPYSRRAFVNWWIGRWELGRADCRATLACHPEAIPVHSAWALSLAALFEAVGGDADAARRLILRADRAYGDLPQYWYSGRHAWATAVASWILGDIEQAQRRADRSVRELERLRSPVPLMHVLPDVIEIRVAAGEMDGARAAAERLRTVAGRLATRLANALAAAGSGLAGEGSEGERSLEIALEECRAVGVPFMAARVAEQLARRRTGESRALLLREAARSYASLPAPAFERRAVEALRALGPAGKRAAQSVGALTSREREVAALAKRGLRTSDIAVRLHLSERTVESHLAHAYGKLGVRDRAELRSTEL